MSKIHPVILCGGSGTRLWPLSRKAAPKQFVAMMGEQTLFQESIERLSGDQFAAPLIVTNSDFRFIVSEQMAAIGAEPDGILIEPDGRNTAPAVLAAALWIEKRAPDALLLVAPSDHVVPDAEAFREAVAVGAAAARQGELVTFGIRPDRPETGYGYLELKTNGDGAVPGVHKLARFVEKPDAGRAAEMLAAGNFLWNAGIFLFSVADIIKAFKTHAPNLLQPVQDAVAGIQADLDFLRLGEEAWQATENISIDYAVMERAANLSVVPYDAGWSDLGDWQAVWHESAKDDAIVAASGPTTALDCHNSLLRAEAPRQQVVGIGLENTIVVAMPDAVLVADMSRAQDVKDAVAQLNSKNIAQATQFPVDHRPWGWFESLAIGDRFQVKRIVVKPGASLSLQSHFHRAEHWIVVQGTAKVLIGEEEQLVTENQSVYVPLGAKHRLSNPGKVPTVMIEVQTGSYLGEDDIVRYEDIYARE